MPSPLRSAAPVTVRLPAAMSAARHSTMQAFGRAVAHQVAVWQHRARTRRQLRTMDDRMLRDIGLSPYVARTEGDKPFWLP